MHKFLIGLLVFGSISASASDLKITSSIKIVKQVEGLGSANKPYLLTDSYGQTHELVCGSLEELRIKAPNIFGDQYGNIKIEFDDYKTCRSLSEVLLVAKPSKDKPIVLTIDPNQRKLISVDISSQQL